MARAGGGTPADGAPLTSRRAFAADGTGLTAHPTAVAQGHVRSVDDEHMRGIVGDALPLQTRSGNDRPRPGSRGLWPNGLYVGAGLRRVASGLTAILSTARMAHRQRADTPVRLQTKTVSHDRLG